jgi:hypothetical protein
MTTRGLSAVPDRPASGVLDTCAYIDLDVIDPGALPVIPEITAVTLAELHQGVALAKDTATRAARTKELGAAVADFECLPFDGEAADGSNDRCDRFGQGASAVHA